MAKDPAFLFYPADWMTGTMIFNRHLKGCYMDLLIAQFNHGPLSLETIKTVLGTDQASWTVLSKKFKQDSEGNFFNERLATEIEKRKNFYESKIKNGNKGGRPPNKKTYSKPIGLANENLSVNRNRNRSFEFENEIEMPFTSENFRVLWQNWKKYRLQEFGKKYKSMQSEQAALSHLVSLAGGKEESAREVIAQSIANQWQGLFELKNPQNNGSAGNKNKRNSHEVSAESAFSKIDSMPDTTGNRK